MKSRASSLKIAFSAFRGQRHQPARCLLCPPGLASAHPSPQTSRACPTVIEQPHVHYTGLDLSTATRSVKIMLTSANPSGGINLNQFDSVQTFSRVCFLRTGVSISEFLRLFDTCRQTPFLSVLCDLKSIM